MRKGIRAANSSRDVSLSLDITLVISKPNLLQSFNLLASCQILVESWSFVFQRDKNTWATSI